MRNVKRADTKPEILVRSHLHRSGLRFSLHRSDLPGSPDIVLPKFKSVVFVHGCFWHQHAGCKKSARPKTNRVFWSEKLHRNATRDREAESQLIELGWTVHTVWECELHEENLDALTELIRST